MKIRQRDTKDIRIYELEGRIDIGGAAILNKVLQGTVADGHRKIVLDMNGVSYMNSESLHILAKIQTDNRHRGGDLRLARLNPLVQRLFNIAGLGRFFPNYASVESAAVNL